MRKAVDHLLLNPNDALCWFAQFVGKNDRYRGSTAAYVSAFYFEAVQLEDNEEEEQFHVA